MCLALFRGISNESRGYIFLKNTTVYFLYLSVEGKPIGQGVFYFVACKQEQAAIVFAAAVANHPSAGGAQPQDTFPLVRSFPANVKFLASSFPHHLRKPPPSNACAQSQKKHLHHTLNPQPEPTLRSSCFLPQALHWLYIHLNPGSSATNSTATLEFRLQVPGEKTSTSVAIKKWPYQ